jgi:hypothetical protein
MTVIDEGLRMADHPGVIFKDGPAGRRAGGPRGPDIWEVIKYVREIDARGPAALDAAAEAFAVRPGRIAMAVSYYGDYPATSTPRLPPPTRHRSAPSKRGGCASSSSGEPGRPRFGCCLTP